MTQPMPKAIGDTEDLTATEEILQVYAGLIDDDHGLKTPQRFLSMLSELTQCRPIGNEIVQAAHMQDCIKWASFPNEPHVDEMIVVQKIPFVSVCNHHVVPFMGYADVAYVPDQTIAGLSKFARVVKHFARQLQVQERLTANVADFLEDKLKPKGLAVMMRAEHLCMTIRGTQTPGTLTTTSAMRGVFSDHSKTAKTEFLTVVGFNGQG